MSAFGDTRTQVQMDFGTGVIQTETVGADADTGENSFTPKSGNRILDVVHDVNPAAGQLFTLKTRRQERRRVIGRTAAFSTAFTGDKRIGFPVALAAGFFQYVTIQTAGTAVAQNYIITYQNPLNL